MDKDAITQTETREFFRIDDDLCFDYFILPSHTANKSVAEHDIQERLFTPDEYHHYQLIRKLYEIDNEANQHFAEIARHQPQVSRYLECLHQKFNLLAQSLYQRHKRPSRQLNLSIGGMAFHSSEAIPDNSRLKVKIMFYPSGLGVVATLKVLRHRHLPARDQEKPYLISGQFLDLSVMDEQIIHQHILQKQLLDR